MIQSPAYYRVRLAAIADELRIEPDERRIKLLQNGYFPDWAANPPYDRDNSPLSFFEICCWDTWFTMHPEKICGEVTVTSNREFPLAVKASREDVIRTVSEGIYVAKAEHEILNLNF